MTPSDTKSLGDVVKVGVGWMMLGRAANLVIRFGAGIALARLLEPADFGVFGITLIFTGFANYFTNVGFELAYMQRKEVREDHASTLFVLNFVLFACAGLVLELLSPWIGVWFESELVGQVQALLALELFLSPFYKVPTALLARRMEFRRLAANETAHWLVGSCTSITLAALGHGVWSLVLGRLVGLLVACVLALFQARWLPRWRVTRAAARDLSAYGFKMLAKNVTIYATEKIDFFVVGKRLGEMPLGLYEKAFNTMDLFVRELSIKLCSVLFPAFSKIQDDRSRVAGAYVKVVMATSLVCLPLFAGLYIVASSFVAALYGEKWLPCVLPLQLLCAAGWMRLHNQLAATVINALGFVGAEVKIRVVTLVLLGAGCWLGSGWGIVGVSVAVLTVTALLSVALLLYIWSLIGLRWKVFVVCQAPAAAAAAGMLGILVLFQSQTRSALGEHSLTTLTFSTLLGMLAYPVLLWLLRSREVDALLRELGRDARKIVRRGIRARDGTAKVDAHGS
jgi:PST family polysaccharide transporter